jgi:hypothetical protein
MARPKFQPEPYDPRQSVKELRKAFDSIRDSSYATEYLMNRRPGLVLATILELDHRLKAMEDWRYEHLESSPDPT